MGLKWWTLNLDGRILKGCAVGAPSTQIRSGSKHLQGWLQGWFYSIRANHLSIVAEYLNLIGAAACAAYCSFGSAHEKNMPEI